MRDVVEISRRGLPVFCLGASPLGPYKSGPGELRGTVSLGGTAVHDGDLIVGDPDGVVVVPPDRVEAVLSGGQAALAREERSIAQAQADELDTSWLDEAVETEMVEHTP